MDSLNFNSVESIPSIEARAAFTVNSACVFKEDVDIIPTILSHTLSYIPWGDDNQMSYDIFELVDKDETLPPAKSSTLGFAMVQGYVTTLAPSYLFSGCVGMARMPYPPKYFLVGAAETAAPPDIYFTSILVVFLPRFTMFTPFCGAFRRRPCRS